MTKLVSFQKSTMHPRPSYEELLHDTVLEPKDRIALPNRRAMQLRNTQQLSMWDDPTFLDLDTQAKNVTINQLHHNEVNNIIQQSPDKTQAEERAMRPPPPPPDDMMGRPKHYPQVPKFSRDTQTTEDTAPTQSIHSRPPPPPGSGGIKSTSSSSTQTAQTTVRYVRR